MEADKPSIIKVRDRLKIIDQELAQIEQQKLDLHAEREILISSHAEAKNDLPEQSKTLSTNEKVQLFKRLFRGRVDIFANRWQSNKGRSGYSVACNNEWVPEICNKPKVKCMDCAHQNFKVLDKKAIYAHLSGKQVVGLYPLLQDNTCYLIAIDFDKTDWQESASAVAEVCRQFNVPHALEISRSGNGAHLWIFFSEPITAKEARLLGFALLDKAMESYPDLSFESYDRLFPNQDIMPDGGFGNLIALPLQYQARQQGNTQFWDRNLEPFKDQWVFLNTLKALSANQLRELIFELKPHTLRDSEYASMNEQMPWEQGARLASEIIENCPKCITLTLANHIYIRNDDVPAPLITRLKRLASFSNPVFFKTQAMRFSTHGIPRYITCARMEHGPGTQKWLSLPRGCFDDVVELLTEQSIEVKIDDKRNSGESLRSIKFLGKLRKDQSKAVTSITKHDHGVLHAPTAFGKTVTAIGIINKRKTNTLILTHSKQLLAQWHDRLNAFVEGVDIGVFHGGKKKPSHQIDIATYQSLVDKKDNTVNQLVQDYGQVIIDECHHISAPRFEMVLNEVRAKYVLGLTATPYRQDGHQKIIFMTAGPIRYSAKPMHSKYFKQSVIAKQLFDKPPADIFQASQPQRITDVYKWIMENEERSKVIVDDIFDQVRKGRNPLVLTERRLHAETLSQLLLKSGLTTVVLRGAMGAKELKNANQKLPDVQVIVATGKYIGEGFDLPRLDTLFLAMPVSWKGSLTQYAGRIHRELDGKDQVTIFDYIDASLPMLQRMFKKREKGFKSMGYDIEIR